jgi:hypothetical protein
MTSYYLHVDLIVKDADAAEFEELSTKFLTEKGFQRLSPNFKGTLALALRTKDKFAFTGYAGFQGSEVESRDKTRIPDGTAFQRFVHLWQLPTLNDLDLGAVMTQAADDELYRAIDGLVVDEVQHYVSRAPSTATLLSGHSGTLFTRATQLFKSKSLGPYLFSLGTIAPIMQSTGKAPWSLFGAFQSVTGELNSIVEFWRSEKEQVSFGDRFGELSERVIGQLQPLRTAPLALRTERLVLTKYSPPLA